MSRVRDRSGDREPEHFEAFHGDELPAQISDAQEFDFLKKRQGATMRAAEVANEIANARSLQRDFEGDGAVRAWKFARKLRQLYDGFAERVRGYGTFSEFAADEFDLEHQRVSELLRFSLVPSEEKARAYGMSKGMLGAQLMDALGLTTFRALEAHPLKTEKGETVLFPGTARKLKSALKVLRAPKKDAAPDAGEPSEELKEKTRERSAWLKKVLPDFPNLADTKLSFEATPGEDEPELVIHGRVSKAGRREMGDLLRRLAKVESAG